MKNDLLDYQITPKIFKCGQYSEIEIKPLGKHAAFPYEEYIAQFIPMNESTDPAHDYDVVKAPVAPDGCLRIGYCFNKEQEYYIRLFKAMDVASSEDKPRKVCDKKKAFKNFNVYALDEDLYNKRPYRGDFHAHSCFSDGREDPEIVAANYRKNGYDFFGLTDHHRYAPSVQCSRYYEDKPTDLLIVRGEEVHAPNNHVHIVNFGGNSSVNSYFDEKPEEYDREVRKIMVELDLPEGVNAYEYASCQWVFRKIREAGGLAVYAHPHWMSDAYHVPDSLSTALFNSTEMDAFELLGGHEVHSNNLQLAFYQPYTGRIPIVGASDAHSTSDGAKWFKWSSTIMFTEELSAEKIISNVRDFYSVAVEHYPNEGARVHGSYRLVLFSRFLLDEYFPLHDEMCFEEGRLMKEMFLGDNNAVELLRLMSGRTKSLLDRYWGVNQ